MSEQVSVSRRKRRKRRETKRVSKGLPSRLSKSGVGWKRPKSRVASFGIWVRRCQSSSSSVSDSCQFIDSSVLVQRDQTRGSSSGSVQFSPSPPHLPQCRTHLRHRARRAQGQDSPVRVRSNSEQRHLTPSTKRPPRAYIPFPSTNRIQTGPFTRPIRITRARGIPCILRRMDRQRCTRIHRCRR